MCFDLGKGPGGHVKENFHRIPDKSRLTFLQFCACQEISEMSEREGTLRLHFYVSALFLCCFFAIGGSIFNALKFMHLSRTYQQI